MAERGPAAPAVVVTGPAGGPFYATKTATSVTITSTTGTQTVSWQAMGVDRARIPLLSKVGSPLCADGTRLART
jgi:hypothetical protein